MATGDDPQQIIRYGRPQMEREEAQAAGVVRTGMLLEKNGDQVQPHATSGGAVGTTKVAIDWRAIGMQKGDEYAAGDNVHYVVANGGGAFMPVAAGNAVVEGELAVSDGAGGVRTYTPNATEPDSAEAVIGEFDESVDNAAGTEAVYVRVDLTN